MTRLQELNLYTVTVYTRIPNGWSDRDGVCGSFFAAAVDSSQAKFIGEQWATDHNFKASRVETRKRTSAKTVYAVSGS